MDPKTGVPSGNNGGAPGAPDSGGSSERSQAPEEGTEPRQKLPIEVILKETCVRPGGAQTITIRTLVGSGVAFDNVYSDGKSGTAPDHYGGNVGGQVDREGTFTNTWVVAAHAPAGKVVVNVLGGHVDFDSNEAKATYSVADVTGNCA